MNETEEVVSIEEKKDTTENFGSPSSVDTVHPSTPSTFDSRRFRSTISTIESDISKNSTSFATEKLQRNAGSSVCQRCCCIHKQDIVRLCCQCVMICPMVFCVGSFVLCVAFIISFFTGRVVVRGKGVVSVKFFKDFLVQHIEHSKLATHSLSEIDFIREFLCSPKNYSYESDLVNEYLLRYVKYNPLFLHHLRVISYNGSEVSRIDLEHDDSSSISTVLYDVKDRPYHKDFLSKKSWNKPYVGPWKTHGSLPFVPEDHKYEYTGDDPFGDHHVTHLEYFPLPQIIKLQKSIICNSTYSGGYIIMNIRMVKVLNQMDATNELYTVVIINEIGDYIFYNSDRTKEFQSELNKRQTLSEDWGLGSEVIHDNLFETKQAVFTVGLSEFMCEEIEFSESEYHICIIVSSLNSLSESAVPLVLGITIDIIFLLAILCCYFNYIIRRQVTKYESLIKNIYPKHIPRPMIRGLDVIARYQSNLCIIFADISKFLEFSEQFHCDPFIIVSVLGTMIDVVDVFASHYQIYKIKTIGNCYFGVSGLSFKVGRRRKKNISKELQKDRERVKKVIRFCCLFNRFFATRKIIIKGSDLGALEIPKFRVGVSFGGAACGILNKNTPYFDLWGRSVYLGSKLEKTSEPGKIQISKRVYEILRGDSEHKIYDFQKRKETFVRGYGYCNTYFVKFRNSKLIDKLTKKIYRSNPKFRKCEKKFEMKSEQEIKEYDESQKTEMLQEIVLQLETQNRTYMDSQILENQQHKKDHFGEEYKKRKNKNSGDLMKKKSSEQPATVIIPGSFSDEVERDPHFARNSEEFSEGESSSETSFNINDDGVELEVKENDDDETNSSISNPLVPYEINDEDGKKKAVLNSYSSSVSSSWTLTRNKPESPNSVVIKNGKIQSIKFEDYRFESANSSMSMESTDGLVE